MSDMIERLRNAQRLMFDHNSTQPGLYGQAADEIELLRGQLLSSYARVDELEADAAQARYRMNEEKRMKALANSGGRP